jgi:ABC-type polysaccharide/polyol phosphate export permease
VESANTVLFWLVPIFYSFAIIPERFREIYQFNPVAALVLASRDILLQAQSPAQTLLLKLAASSCFMLLTGFLVFRILKRRFYNYL